MVHICNGILLSCNKEWNNAICSNMNGPRDYHIKWSKSDRERQISYDIIHTWNLILKDTNVLIYKTGTDLPLSKQTCYQRGKVVGEG